MRTKDDCPWFQTGTIGKPPAHSANHAVAGKNNCKRGAMLFRGAQQLRKLVREYNAFSAGTQAPSLVSTVCPVTRLPPSASAKIIIKA